MLSSTPDTKAKNSINVVFKSFGNHFLAGTEEASAAFLYDGSVGISRGLDRSVCALQCIGIMLYYCFCRPTAQLRGFVCALSQPVSLLSSSESVIEQFVDSPDQTSASITVENSLLPADSPHPSEVNEDHMVLAEAEISAASVI